MTDRLVTAGPGNSSGLLIMLVFMVVLMLWMMSSQRRRARKTQELQESLHDGDAVITSAGIFGTLRGYSGARASVEIAPGVLIDIDRAQIVPVPEHLREEQDPVTTDQTAAVDQPGTSAPTTSSQE